MPSSTKPPGLSLKSKMIPDVLVLLISDKQTMIARQFHFQIRILSNGRHSLLGLGTWRGLQPFALVEDDG